MGGTDLQAGCVPIRPSDPDDLCRHLHWAGHILQEGSSEAQHAGRVPQTSRTSTMGSTLPRRSPTASDVAQSRPLKEAAFKMLPSPDSDRCYP
jgi:hypothetical protein